MNGGRLTVTIDDISTGFPFYSFAKLTGTPYDEILEIADTYAEAGRESILTDAFLAQLSKLWVGDRSRLLLKVLRAPWRLSIAEATKENERRATR
jgi:hypothetical protein